MADIAEFVLARIAEDQAIAESVRAERGDVRGDQTRSVQEWAEFDSSEPHVAVGHDRMLAECAAKRKIIVEHGPDSHQWCIGCHFGSDEERMYKIDECPTKRMLAEPYADHPDYRPEWRP